jgi:aspartyl-tRNA(Asn)/glutamyl-tRNA(Gln) amidotransferase subunit C
MSFSIESVHKLASLARLKLSSEESERMQRDLNDIVLYVEQLFAVDVENIPPMTHAIPMDLPRRQDVAVSVIGREGILGSAGYDDGLVRVPKIIE